MTLSTIVKFVASSILLGVPLKQTMHAIRNTIQGANKKNGT
jgi:hypothetical protein